MAVTDPGVGVGVFLLMVGTVLATWPYEAARLSEQIDAIGSKRRWGTVEPADWLVLLIRYVGIALGLVGALSVIVNV